MWLPADCFDGRTPERTAAEQLNTLFTFVALRCVFVFVAVPCCGGMLHHGYRSARVATDCSSSLPPHPYRVCRRVVLAQIGPGGEGGDLPPTPQYLFLRGFYESNRMTNGDRWLAALMEQEGGQLLGEDGGEGWAALRHADAHGRWLGGALARQGHLVPTSSLPPCLCRRAHHGGSGGVLHGPV